MNVNRINDKDNQQNEKLHEWIDNDVPQMIDENVANQSPEIVFDEEALKKIEKEVTKLLKNISSDV